MKQHNKTIALYCRLSRDDENEGYSSSIMSQKQILSQYAKQHGMSETEFYIDDGFSGTNYDRPDFKRLERDIEAGKISTVITKEAYVKLKLKILEKYFLGLDYKTALVISCAV